MTTKHSVGPWRYDYEPGYCGELIAADGTTVCTFSDEPNAKDAMVMSAGPDLLETLQKLLDLQVAKKELEYLDKGIGTKTPNAAWLEARSAIAKAKGEQQ